MTEAGTTGYLCEKHMVPHPCLASYSRINLRWSVYLTAEAKMEKLTEENIGNTFSTFSRQSSPRTQKSTSQTVQEKN